MSWLVRLSLLLPLLLFLGAAALFFWGLADPERDPGAVPTALLDKPVPDFALPPVEGLDVPGLASADLAGRTGDRGAVTLVNFFASWCLPCRVEHPLLTRLAEDEGLRLVGINYKDEAAAARAWLGELGNPYERIGADSGRAGIAWGITGVPETFVVSPEGRICHHQAGPLSAPELAQSLRPAIEACR